MRPLPHQHGSFRPSFVLAGRGTPASATPATAPDPRAATPAVSGATSLASSSGPTEVANGVAGIGRRLVGRLAEVGRRLLAAEDLDVHDVAQVVVVDRRHQQAEHLEALALPGDERVGLGEAAQVDPLAQEVHLGEVVPPALVDDLQHDLALELAGRVGAAGEGPLAGLVVLERLGPDALDQLLGARRPGRGRRR